ncbi:maestro heat-like repeat-containing protein family member 1, partial [Chrysemys picta bellii]|uniref:maestro heat-like repeat-containing protein family member 1 n=1 Tax=Chrysemys picta bellii TaxID=8478 RepID=UPI0032B11773
MIQHPALAKLRGTEVAKSSALRAEVTGPWPDAESCVSSQIQPLGLFSKGLVTSGYAVNSAVGLAGRTAVESLQELPWEGLDLVLQTFLEQHLTPTTLLHLFLHLQPWICSPRAQERSRAVRASARLFMFYRFKAITEDLKPMVEQGYMAGLLTSQAFDAQEATRYWASQALYWLFTPCKAVVYTKTGAVVSVLSKTQKDASCRENPVHVAMLIAKHLQSSDLMPFSFTLLVGLLEKEECADQLAGVMEAVLREQESELQGQVQDLQAALSYTLSPPRVGRLSERTRDILHLLARQHTKTAVSILLKMPWPYK